MADTINTDSFFNQPEGEGGDISSVKVLAQNAFDIATNIRAQFQNFVQSFDQYKFRLRRKLANNLLTLQHLLRKQ